MKILLIGANTSSIDTIEELLDNTHVTACRADFPIVALPANILEFALIVTTDDNPDLMKLLAERAIPEYLPILIVGRETTSFDELLKLRNRRTIDYVRHPLTPDYFLFKLQMLEHLRNLGAEHHRNLETHSHFLDRLASRDGLTGLYNRRHLSKILDDELAKARETGADLSLLILDIDYFRELNKSHGHSFGDSVLNEMSARLTRTTRDQDTCFRFSGEDFVVLMPGADVEQAQETAEKLRLACASKTFDIGTVKKHITISIGIASNNRHHPDSPDEFLTMAETAMFMAKAEGRNRVCLFTPLEANRFSAEKNLASLKVTISRILDKTRNSAIASLQLLAKDMAGTEHQNHIQNVSYYVSLLGEKLGLPTTLIRTFQNAIVLNTSIRFLLHNDLISKQDRFSKEDRKKMNEFPYKLAEITDVFDYFANERSILLYHGEHFDGSGFPEGLKGDEIPLGARIFTIIDALAAMSCDRPFRSKLEPKAIIKELYNEAGGQFDPFLVLKTLDIILENNLLDVEQDFIENIRTDLISQNPELES
jgi:diguanylate cyclase (GGDEF)-like protein